MLQGLVKGECLIGQEIEVEIFVSALPQKLICEVNKCQLSLINPVEMTISNGR